MRTMMAAPASAALLFMPQLALSTDLGSLTPPSTHLPLVLLMYITWAESCTLLPVALRMNMYVLGLDGSTLAMRSGWIHLLQTAVKASPAGVALASAINRPTPRQ